MRQLTLAMCSSICCNSFCDQSESWRARWPGSRSSLFPRPALHFWATVCTAPGTLSFISICVCELLLSICNGGSRDTNKGRPFGLVESALILLGLTLTQVSHKEERDPGGILTVLWAAALVFES